jgi:hypothetical protein
MCTVASAPWGVPRPSLADYVMVTGPTGGAIAPPEDPNVGYAPAGYTTPLDGQAQKISPGWRRGACPARRGAGTIEFASGVQVKSNFESTLGVTQDYCGSDGASGDALQPRVRRTRM